MKFDKRLDKKLIVFIVLWGIMFVMNCLTLLCVDDYSYHYNMLDGSSVDSIADVIKALYDHYFVQNGRLVAHFFAYIFLLMPKLVFNFINAGMFVLLVWKICDIAKGKNKQNLLFLIAVYGCIWIFEPAFGQVNLWLDGACNYLFALVFGVFYFSVYVELLRGKAIKGKAKIAFFWIYSFLFGSYSENISLCVGFGCLLIVLYIVLVKKLTVGVAEWGGLLWGLAGFCFLAFAPSSMNNKLAHDGLGTYVYNLVQIIMHYYDVYKILLVMWIAAFVVAVYMKCNKDIMVISVVSFIISITSVMMCAVGQYVSDRSKCGSLIFLLIAVWVLLYEEWNSKYQIVIAITNCCLIMLATVWMIIGSYDILLTYQKTSALESAIKQAAAQNEDIVYVKHINALTKYSSSYKLPELDENDSTVWPNCEYAKYYGINEIYGVSVDK